jgi:hypothetical protein
MGTIKQGILGGFSGKVGTVIGGSWKGISYMRSQAQSIKNPRTEAQMSQRIKFALALSFLKPMTELLRIGFKLYANKKTAFNSAMSYTLANAISGDYPDYELQFANALVSRGALTVATNGTATSSSGNVVISWDDNSGVGAAKATDKTLIAILNADRGEAVTVSAGEARVTGTQTLAVPADWLGENVHVYLGFVSEDFKEVANSVYLGSVTIA